MNFRISDLYLLAPVIAVALLALVVLAVSLVVKRRAVIAGISLVGLVIPAALVVAQKMSLTGTDNTGFSGMLIVDQYALFFDVLFLIVAAVMILVSYNYIGQYVKADGEFYSLLLFSIAGMMLMASTTELITIYISLELTSFPLYVMAGLLRKSKKSSEAALKYVLLGAMSSAILLYGFALIYGLTGTTDLVTIAKTFTTSWHDGNILVLVADILIIAGFGFKISAVPFHMWAPDIYEGAPTPATAFFSVGSKAAGFAALLRIFVFGGVFQVETTGLILVLSIVAVATMILGNVVAAVQTNIKRLMAYSSIAQAGYLLVGLIASIGTGNPAGNQGLLVYIMIYMITNLGAFAGIIALANLIGGEKIEDFRGLWKRSPLLSIGTAICLLSLAGIPPAAGFFSKLILFTAAWGLGYWWLALIALICSVVSLVYYGRIIKAMFFDEPAEEGRLAPGFSLNLTITLASAALIVFFVGINIILVPALEAAKSLLAFF